jgi:hypothetical protein
LQSHQGGCGAGYKAIKEVAEQVANDRNLKGMPEIMSGIITGMTESFTCFASCYTSYSRRIAGV